MSTKIEKKLKVNRDRRDRENLLDVMQPSLRSVFENVRVSSDTNDINLAYSTWSDGKLMTTRGQVKGWCRQEFSSWSSLTTCLQQQNLPKSIPGWFLFQVGPFFELDSSTIQQYLTELLVFATSQRMFDLAWVGAHADVGFVTEYNTGLDGESEFEICSWGLVERS